MKLKVIPRLADAEDCIRKGIPFRNRSGTMWSRVVENELLATVKINDFPREVSQEILASGKDAYLICTYMLPIAVFTLENGSATLFAINHINFESPTSRHHLDLLKKWFAQP